MAPKRLFIYVGGAFEKPGMITPLFDRLRAEPGYGADEALYWEYPDPVHAFTGGTMAEHSRDLADRIDAYHTGPRRTPEIVLVGHSLGGIQVRYAYIQALRGIDGPKLDWARAVTRIVLFATLNRGIEPSRLPWWQHLLLVLATPYVRTRAFGDLLSGSPFITNMRIRWMHEFAVLGKHAPKVVQLRADVDDLVEDEDSRDLESMPTGVQKVIPRATHADVISVDTAREDYPGQRFDILRWALTEPVRPTDPAPVPPTEAAKTSVVFALHGIRSGSGDWPTEIATILSENDHNALVVTPSYGRLSAYDFALPFTRRRNLRWFADRYSYFLARHPDKPFHFVGHSNGTYLFGRTLDQIPALRFDHVFLAGSVLPREFDWSRVADQGQVGTLVNVCASADKPVAWLCSALRGFGIRDIGVGGFTGFDSVPPSAVQVRSIKGGHGAALTPDRLAGVAEFVRSGDSPNEGPLVTPTEAFGVMSRFAPTAGWLATGALLALGWLGLLTLGALCTTLVLAGVLIVTYGALKVM
ncbi:hypothetical protein D5S18_20235 [Nocardia panacis]|uniref:Alpha/beta hydrolase n=2 Tax=Nocardia panacis TaxID=2340916 RepID=A0A3A4KDH6_9NOCA|nr:hypothetical protein D5S18_20235 [Nocardia panacis]